MSDNVTRFPQKFLGAPAQYTTLDSEIDQQNPSTNSLRALLNKRRELINKYTGNDGSVREIEGEIARRLDELVCKPTADAGASHEGGESEK